MYHGAFETLVLVNGAPISEYPHQGNIFIEGRRGSRYILRFRNQTAWRVLAIPSVDGLSVMNGQQAGPQSPGYVVGPHGQIDIPGWRKDNNAVNEFYFSSVPRSYAERTDQSAANVGVIGMMVFGEQQEPQQQWFNNSVTAPAQPFPSGKFTLSSAVGKTYRSPSNFNGVQMSLTAASASPSVPAEGHVVYDSFAQPALGTGFGDTVGFQTTDVTFKKQAYPAATLVLYYDDRKGLERRGIVFPTQYQPNAFPQAQTNGCPTPSHS